MISGAEAIGLVKNSGVVLICAALLMLVGGVLGGIIGYGKGKANCQPVAADTITVVKVDTVTLVEPRDTLTRIVWKPYPVAVHDTVKILRHTTDSIFISLPYQYRYYGKPDTLDIWYSGVDPKIDSAKVYMHHTTEIVKHPYEVSKIPRLTLDLGAAAFYSDKSINPCLVGEMRYNATKTIWSAYGAIDPQARWAAGVSLTYRMNLIK